MIRKEIHELLLLYSLEPQLRDVYVEGLYDQNLIEWFLKDQNIDNINVYTIDAINVPNELIESCGLNPDSNRSRVITLSIQLSTELRIPNYNILCIADRDYEDYIPSVNTNTYLEFTDYTSIDIYLWQKCIVEKMFSLVLGGFSIPLDQLVSDIIPILKELYVLRLANVALGWNMEWISIAKPKFVKISGNITFDSDCFTKAYLQKNCRWADRDEFKETLEGFRNRLNDDPRYCIRGHDLMELLNYVVNKLKKLRTFGDSDTFQGAFTGCLEARNISDEVLFQRILTLS